MTHEFNKSPWQLKSRVDVENKVPTRRILFTRFFRSKDVHSKAGGAQWPPKLTPRSSLNPLIPKALALVR